MYVCVLLNEMVHHMISPLFVCLGIVVAGTVMALLSFVAEGLKCLRRHLAEKTMYEDGNM